MNKSAISIAAVVFALGLSSFAQAATVFDFEEFSGNTNYTDTSLTSLSSTKDGITMDLSRTGSTGFTVYDATSGFPSSWGSKHLSPFGNMINDKFVADFSTALSGVSIESSDFNQDDDTLYFEVWSGLGGTGTQLYSTSQFITSTFSLPSNIAAFNYSGSSFRSIVFYSRGAFDQSIYWDNIQVTAVPLPSAGWMGLGLLGGLAGLRVARRRRATI